ncbi:type II secretion system protein [Duganella sp.]|uniref:type II secretion system protein n=1 Tax=Duganella sp. TaxID=1904440 RepID=UPI0031E30927
MCNNRRRQQGLTLIELIMFMVIVGAAAAGLLQIMNMANTNSTDPIRRKQALLIAEAYMEEVQQAQMSVCDPADDNAATAITSAQCTAPVTVENWGPEGGNARPFDNVNDYVPNNYISGTAVRAFAVNDGTNLIDRDVAGNPLGANAAGGALANSTLAGITTTLALTPVALGPAGSQVPAADALLITITVTYGAGANDVVTLQGYRSRYEPRAR